MDRYPLLSSNSDLLKGLKYPCKAVPSPHAWPVTRRSFLQTLEGSSVNIVSVPLQTLPLRRKCSLIYALLTLCQQLTRGLGEHPFFYISYINAKCCRLSQCQVSSVGSHVVHITMLNHPIGMHCISWHRHLATNHPWPHGIPDE